MVVLRQIRDDRELVGLGRYQDVLGIDQRWYADRLGLREGELEVGSSIGGRELVERADELGSELVQQRAEGQAVGPAAIKVSHTNAAIVGSVGLTPMEQGIGAGLLFRHGVASDGCCDGVCECLSDRASGVRGTMWSSGPNSAIGDTRHAQLRIPEPRPTRVCTGPRTRRYEQHRHDTWARGRQQATTIERPLDRHDNPSLPHLATLWHATMTILTISSNDGLSNSRP